MPAIRISKRAVDTAACPAGRPSVTCWDESLKGFGLLVTAKGSKSYIVQYRMGGRDSKVRRYTIGRHGSPWTPESARARAAELLHKVGSGTDPAAEERARREGDAKRSADDEWFDFDTFADRFIKLHVVAGGLRSERDIRQTFDRDLRPAFSGRSVRDIDIDDVKRMRTAVGLRSQAAANKAHKWLSRMYTWGIEHDRLKTSPLFGLRKPFPEGKRTRFLARDEIKALVLATASLSAIYRAIVVLLLLSGQRLREVAGMRWEEFNDDLTEWLIPASRTKNKLPHIVPLPSQMREVLRTWAGNGERKGLLFTTTGSTPVSGFSKWKAEFDEALAGAGVPVLDWVIHDLRRTFSTHCAGLRIPTEHVEPVLNHISGLREGVAGTYNVYAYFDEKKEALQAYGDFIGTIVDLPICAQAPSLD